MAIKTMKLSANPKVMIKDAITTIEAAAILGRDPSAVRHMIRRKTLDYERRGRDNYVSKKAVLKILEQREAKTNGKK